MMQALLQKRVSRLSGSNVRAQVSHFLSANVLAALYASKAEIDRSFLDVCAWRSELHRLLQHFALCCFEKNDLEQTMQTNSCSGAALPQRSLFLSV
jgi:hypothetical protein